VVDSGLSAILPLRDDIFTASRCSELHMYITDFDDRGCLFLVSRNLVRGSLESDVIVVTSIHIKRTPL